MTEVLILHGEVGPDAPADEQDVLVQVAAVGQALSARGRRWAAWPVSLDLQGLKARLQADRPELVFNLVETLDGQGRLAHLVAALLEQLGVAFTGSGHDALVLSGNKWLARTWLHHRGLPVPAGERQPGALSANDDLWIVKPLWEDASVGIDDHSVCQGPQAARLLAAHPDRFAERFVDGREFNVGLLQTEAGVVVLPVAEIRFDQFPPGKPRILGYAAKWQEDSFEYRHTPRQLGLEQTEPALAGALSDIARRCWNALALRGYARVDLRVDGQGQPWLLEVNANPCLAPDAGFAAMLACAGMAFADAIAAICNATRHQPAALPASPSPTLPALPAGLAWRTQTRADDRPAVQRLVAAAGNFSADERAIALELVEAVLAQGDASGYQFLWLEQAGQLVGYSCFGDIPGSEHSWDLYWIVVDPARQGQGLGRLLLSASERVVRARGGAQLFIDTSGQGDYAATRAFYRRCGYQLAAELPDFYRPGDGKCIFVRGLLDP